ncbi:TROVE domain-containing protein [Mycobacterium adipatum]|uniref:TROVE domain-containing protein n=1 Tax=Mycobacterium adipatum TaxID=1682113 RepID=UPI002CD96662|nr:TROVE domain-containing protein [Rhodoglobus sp.]
MDILTTIDKRHTAQSEQADPRQEKNAAGGYTFTVDDWALVHRFLTLGTDGGTYYTLAADLTKDNAAVVLKAAATDPVELVRRIVDVSMNGRAPKQNPALFALAVASASENVDGRRAALAALPQVARTGTHLFLFAKYVEQFRGWGPALVKGVARWYTNKPVDRLAYQAVKYRQREGWTHRDLLRLSHPKAGSDERGALFDYIARGLPEVRPEWAAELPPIVQDFEDAQRAVQYETWAEIIGRGNGVTWEMLPDAALGHAAVWEALLEQGIPQTALMRQLPRLTRLGLTTGRVGAQIAGQLSDADLLQRGRVHPINVLVAQRTYASGHSARGESTWTPTPQISDALDAAFYNAYASVQPSGKRTLLALDISGSMSAAISGMPLTCREAAAALAMVTAATEADHQIVGFTGEHAYRTVQGIFGVQRRGYIASTSLTPLDISPRRRLDDICNYTAGLPMGATDCALPMVWALKNRVEIDTFHIYTDNETWFGDIHPHQALREYRDKMGIPARLVVVAMTGTRRTIADPTDPGQLDVSGFDSAVPNLIADFSRGDI